MAQIQALRGTRDILPEEVGYWQRLEATARQILNAAAYKEIRPPIFEQTDLFERGIGEATDVVGKEMYTFSDRGDRSITLRPEGTAGVARSAIEHGLVSGGVQRLWYAGPMFRYERPQAGRQRQFHQLGAEVLGSGEARADAEVIAIATDILQRIGLKNLQLCINSVGQLEDRQHYRQALVEYLTPYKDQLDSDSQERLTRNPLRILDSKDERTQEIALGAPSSDAVIKTQPSEPCMIPETNTSYGKFLRQDLYVNKSNSSDNCNAAASGSTNWYFSYFNQGMGYINYYSTKPDTGWVITLAYNSTNVNNLPVKNSPTLTSIFNQVTNILGTLKLKQK